MKNKIIGLAVFFVFGVGCAEYSVKAPQGFAEYEKDAGVYRAVSADSVFFKIHCIENDAKGSVSMWQESLLMHLHSMGYRKLSGKKITTASGLEGEMTEYNYRYYGKTYIYAVTLFLGGDVIYVAESGGIEENYNIKRKSIEAALAGFTPE